MMILKALCHFDWQLLRIMARSKVPVTGKKTSSCTDSYNEGW